MALRMGVWHRASMDKHESSRRVAVLAVLALPVFLFYGRAVADVLACLVDVLFLVHCARGGGWAWVKQPWVAVAGAIWVLQLIASLHAGPPSSEVQAVVMIRILLFVAALEAWVLTGAGARHALWVVFAALAVWTGFQCWEQYLTGHNLLGYPRWGDGSLTGPFYKPRVGPIFLFIALPGLLPVVLRAIGRPGWRSWFGGMALLLVCLTTMILIGQRMPNMLFLFGLCITGLLVRRFRGTAADRDCGGGGGRGGTAGDLTADLCQAGAEILAPDGEFRGEPVWAALYAGQRDDRSTPVSGAGL